MRIERLDGNLGSLEKRVDYFHEGSEQLEFLYPQVRNDLRIIETLKYMKVEAHLFWSFDIRICFGFRYLDF
jgi:hypothetical protein